MNKKMSIVTGLFIIGYLSVILPTVTLSQEAPPAEQTKADYTWKEQLEKKHLDFVEWLQKNYPEKAAQLITDRDKNPDLFVQQLGEVMKTYEPIQKAEKSCPDLAKVLREDLALQNQRDQLIGQIAQAEEEKRPELLKQLRDIVSARFDIIIHKKQLYYEHLRRRLEKLQEKIDTQAKELEQLKVEKDQSVEQRMKELIEQNESINWK